MNTLDNEEELVGNVSPNLQTTNTPDETMEQTVSTPSNPIAKEEEVITLIDLVKALEGIKNAENNKAEIARIKATFYKILSDLQEKDKLAFIEKNGSEQDYVWVVPEEENIFKNILSDIKAKRSQELQEIEKTKEEGLAKKQLLLNRLQSVVDTVLSGTEDVSKTLQVIKEIQQEWRSIGGISSEKYNGMVKKYQILMEQYYDFLKISNDLRDYDFKKNLEAKTDLCQQAEELLKTDDINKAFNRLQQLHSEWRELGPVARELREEVWSRFKTASDAINKAHAIYFQDRKKEEENNYILKKELCNKVETLPISEYLTYKSWEEATKIVLELQESWKKIGFAPKKYNAKIYENFRELCDRFFAAKTLFYKQAKAELQENYDKKKALCEQAEALMNSKEWKQTSEAFIQLQQEWKKIGAVPKKLSDQIWKRFITACDYFFEQKTKEFKGKKSEETDNLLAKRAIIEKILAYTGKTVDELKALMDAYVAIGHVPFKEKDKIYNEYKLALDKQFSRLKVNETERKINMFKHSIDNQTEKSSNALYKEREKLIRLYERINADILTRENNFGFLTATSKKSSSLILEMEKTIEKLKEERDLLLQKIQLLEENLK